MTGTDTAADAPQPRRGRADKAAAVVHAACAVFGRDGFARAGIDAIAKEAGVSTRTIYNHFPGGKEELFRTVIQWSSWRVRDAQLAQLEHYLDPQRPPRPADLERDLLALARAWIGLTTDFPDHFAMVRQIYAEIGHLPVEVLEAWQAAGPRAVGARTTAAVAVLGEHGLLELSEGPEQAAAHLLALTVSEVARRSYWGAVPLSAEENDRLLASGVRAFLRAYGVTATR
ncbi:TetR/AcrR family transcriptional regulator [Kitasatospora sp. LaBMicrA B282]|uniref:TetR/AcrR family transcriptional regulator n=1 Tax=Kitasatospora sp. LaBMicrA B282 TaxID=3420949 RepID=UPI003D0AEFC7